LNRQVGDFQPGFDEEVWVHAEFSGGHMPAPYSQDLRDRVVSAVSSGSSARGAARRFGIGIGTAVRWAQRLRAEGHARARAMGGDHRSRLTGHREAVLTLIARGCSGGTMDFLNISAKLTPLPEAGAGDRSLARLPG